MHHISSHCLAMKILSQNISKTLSWILLKLHELRGSYILEEKDLVNSFGKKGPSAEKYGCKYNS